jgi:hypothetical protein
MNCVATPTIRIASPFLKGRQIAARRGHLHPCRYVPHDRDTKFCASFRSTLADGGVKIIRLPAKNPNLNAFQECWARSVKRNACQVDSFLMLAINPKSAATLLSVAIGSEAYLKYYGRAA